MEAQLQRPTHGGHHHEEDAHNAGLHSAVEGEGEHHTSVLKKVKDKAKKIKDTIKKHGHGHDNKGDHQRREGYEEGDDDEDDDDEEVANDPEVQGTKMHESTVIRCVNLPRETGTNLENPADSREDRYEHDARDQGISRASTQGDRVPASEKSPAIDKQNVDKPMIEHEPPVGLKEDPQSPYNSPANIPPSNHQYNVTHPTRAEADADPLVPRFDNLNIHDAPLSKPKSQEKPDTRSHDQLYPESNPASKPENSELMPKGQDSANTDATSANTVTGKISSATSAVASKAVSAKEVVVSKLGYGGDHQGGQDLSSKKPVLESASEYGHKVAETLAPVYEKVAGTGSAVMAKVQGSGGAEHEGVGTTTAKGANTTVSMKEYLSEKFRPGDEDKALSEVITNALHKQKEEKKVGKVTMSDEVAASLGSGRENKREGEDAVAAGLESMGSGVVDRLRDAVGLWLGKSTGIQTAQDSVAKSYVSDAGGSSGGVAERKQ